MQRAWRRGAESHLACHQIELAVLHEFVAEVDARLRPEQVSDDDPFALWEASLGAEPELTTADEDRDPLLDRLFPAVLPDDPRASAEHRRFSEADLRRQKAAEADVVLAELTAARDRVIAGSGDDTVHDVVVPDTDLTAWLRTLNATRVALAMALDITTADDADALAQLRDGDERAYPFSVYEFLGEVQAILLALQGYE